MRFRGTSVVSFASCDEAQIQELGLSPDFGSDGHHSRRRRPRRSWAESNGTRETDLRRTLSSSGFASASQAGSSRTRKIDQSVRIEYEFSRPGAQGTVVNSTVDLTDADKLNFLRRAGGWQ